MSDKPTALVIQHDLLQVLAGHTMTVGTLEGGEVQIRMYTTDEFMTTQHAIVNGDPHTTEEAKASLRVSRELAEAQTRHYDLQAMVNELRTQRGMR